MTEQTKREAGREAALSDLAKLGVLSRSTAMAEETKKRGPGRWSVRMAGIWEEYREGTTLERYFDSMN